MGYWLLAIGDGLSVMGYVKAVRREKCTKNEKNEFFSILLNARSKK